MKPFPSLLRKVEQSLDRLQVPPESGVIAVSGGADSLALLHALLTLRLQRKAGAARSGLVMAHLNHRLRGAESDADEEFLHHRHRELQSHFGNLTLSCHQADVKTTAEREGDNLESVARRLRYTWLEEVARQHRFAWIATGHTADDQAETILHRLLRGSGLKGLRGIARSRQLTPEITLIRPMLEVRRQEVLGYLEENGLSYREDSSNCDLQFTRNRIRLQLLPHLAEAYNPKIVLTLCHLAEQAEAVFEAEQAEALALLKRAERPRAGTMLILEGSVLAEADRHRVRALFRVLWEREGWPLGEMGYAAWERVVRAALGESGAVDLPGRVRVARRGTVVQLGKGAASIFCTPTIDASPFPSP